MKMMKKCAALVLMLALTVSLVACGGGAMSEGSRTDGIFYEATGVSPEEAAMALGAVTPVASLSETVFEDEKGELGERITSDESEHEPTILSDRLALGEAISRLPPLWRKIVLIRYFRNRTQQETADLLGLTQVKVSREEKKILAFLRGEMTV